MNKNGNNHTPNSEENPFSLPGNYFDSFTKKMMLKIELADELKEFKLLSSIDKTIPFTTPDNYFEVKSELTAYPLVSSIKRQSQFIVPENYFENNTSTILNKIDVLEEIKLYPALSQVDKKNVFEVPSDYFNDLSVQLSEVHSVKERAFSGRVISLVFNRKTAYAIAAMLVISFGLYFFNARTEAANTGCNTLACLDKNEIMKDNHINALDDEALMEMVNTEDLKNNLNLSLNKEEKHSNDKQQSTETYVLENVDVNDITDEI